MGLVTARPHGATRLVLVRHGEPSEQWRGRCYGRLDVGLSDAGRAQAERVAGALAGAGLGAVALYASPRLRALESAAPVGRALGLAVGQVEALRELDFGDFEGLTYEEAEARFPAEYREWMEHPTRVRFPGGESYPEMRARVRAAGRELRLRHHGGCAVVVSHGGVNRTLLAEALGMDDAALFRLGQEHAAVNVVDWFAGGEPVVRVLNWTA